MSLMTLRLSRQSMSGSTLSSGIMGGTRSHPLRPGKNLGGGVDSADGEVRGWVQVMLLDVICPYMYLLKHLRCGLPG